MAEFGTATNWRELIAAAVELDPPTTRDARSMQSAGRPAAVLIAIEDAPDPMIYFTQRSASLTHHPGQISFPGGRLDAGDANLAAAALRESREEIGLDSAHVSMVGALPRYRTVTGFEISPFVGWVNPAAEVRADGVEVERIFKVPLAYAMQPTNYRAEQHRYEGRDYSVYSIDYHGNHIWGATARMLVRLAQRVARVRGDAFAIRGSEGTAGLQRG